MSDLLEKHPYRDQLFELFANNTPLREIVRLGVGVTSKTMAWRLKEEWKRSRPVGQPSKEFVRGQLRAKELKERIESLLELAEKKNDVQAATRLLQELIRLDARVLSPIERQGEQREIPFRIVYEGSTGPEPYILDAINSVGWRVVLRLTLEHMVRIGTVNPKIISAMEFFLETILKAESEARNGIVAEDDSQHSRE